MKTLLISALVSISATVMAASPDYLQQVVANSRSAFSQLLHVLLG